MKTEIVESKDNPGEWVVETIDDANDGQIYGVLFYGSDAKRRAEEYVRLCSC